MGKWLKLFNKKEESHDEAEMERLTTLIINETSEKLKKRFNEELKNELAKGEHIELDFAKRTLDLLIREAIADRKRLIGRIEKDVETGGLFDRYYSKMETINALTNSSFAQMKKMQAYENRYVYEKEVYKNITGRKYEPYAVPDEASLKKPKTRNRDILEIMDECKHSIEDGD